MVPAPAPAPAAAAAAFEVVVVLTGALARDMPLDDVMESSRVSDFAMAHSRVASGPIADMTAS